MSHIIPTIVNLDIWRESSTYWVGYRKSDNCVWYFDSFGDLRPPVELLKYFRGCDIFYN